MGRSPGGHGNRFQYSHLENAHGQRSLAGVGHNKRLSEAQHGHSSADFASSSAHFFQLNYCIGFTLSNPLLGFPVAYTIRVITYRRQFQLNHLSLNVFCDLILICTTLPPTTSFPFLLILPSFFFLSPKTLNICSSRSMHGSALL